MEPLANRFELDKNLSDFLLVRTSFKKTVLVVRKQSFDLLFLLLFVEKRHSRAILTASARVKL